MIMTFVLIGIGEATMDSARTRRREEEEGNGKGNEVI